MKKQLKKMMIILLIISIFSMAYTVLAADSNGGRNIDPGKKGRLTIYKFDDSGLTADEADGEKAEDTSAYGNPVKGVVFTAVRTGGVTTWTHETKNGEWQTEQLYGIDDELTDVLGLSGMAVMEKPEQGLFYYRADEINSAMEAGFLEGNAFKEELEAYAAGKPAMPETDESGHTSLSGLETGTYLVVESLVPEDIASTTDPFFISLPMISADKTEWNYDITAYPKNRISIPDLEKEVSTDDKDYGPTATAAIGQTLYYHITSTLPDITTDATRLTCYDFVDTAEKGLSYINQEATTVKLYHEDGRQETEWMAGDGYFTVVVNTEENQLTVTFTAEGLSCLNKCPNGKVEIAYQACLNEEAILGQEGNLNEVHLDWSRSNKVYSGTLTDQAKVYSYGLELIKTFDDNSGDFSRVAFVLKDAADREVSVTGGNGIYQTIPGGNASLVPDKDGKLHIRGLAAGTYRLLETVTDAGYGLLKEDIVIEITETTDEKNELRTASAKVNGARVSMKEDGSSVHAIVPLNVVNTKIVKFNLPETGGYGTWMYTIGGVLFMLLAGAVFLFAEKKER